MTEKYILVSTIERHISVKQFTAFKDAFNKMLYEMLSAGAPDSIFRGTEYDDGDCGFDDSSGYVTNGKYGYNYDWLIVKL